MHNTKTPFYIALASEAVNIGAVILLIGRYQLLSLAIAFSLAALVQMFLLLFMLRSRFESLDDRRIISSIGKISIATVSGGIVIQILKFLIAKSISLDTFLGVFTQLSLSGLLGLAVFIAACYFLKIPEFLSFKTMLIKKIFGAKKLAASGMAEDAEDISGM
jgi:peptidoglycan biosynthesis protein MviN/MurJ (putative lipid II flippase)